MRILVTVFCLVLGWGCALRAGTLVVSITDPSAAAIPDAEVLAVTTGHGIQTVQTKSDGTATFPGLQAGTYHVVAKKPGFTELAKDVEVPDLGKVTLDLRLSVAPQETAIEVPGRNPAMANADPVYRALREAPVAETFVVENLELQRDAGKFVFRSGTLSFTAPVMGRVVTAAFSGHGTFHLTPAIRFEADHLNLITGRTEIDEGFDGAVLEFTDRTYEELKAALKTPGDPSRTSGVLQDVRKRLRHRTETPRSLGEYLLQGDEIANVEVDILSDLYNPKAEGFFNAYMHGHKLRDLRFFVNPRGALPSLLSTEEVGLVNVDTNGPEDGILYLTHRMAEWQNGTAMNDEDRRVAAARHYQIDTAIGKNEHLTSTATVDFELLRDGDRVIPFSLLPNLRVSRVLLAGKEIPFVQEGRRSDAALALILPKAANKGDKLRAQIEYQGDQVIHNAGGGSFAVGARTDWYPALNAMHDRATYDLKFQVPRRYTLVSVGKEVSDERQDDREVTHWVSDVPLAVAGFNYGEFKRKEAVDGGYGVEVYATSELPDYLKAFSQHSAMTPSSLAASTLVDAENALRCFRYWFGDAPFGRIAITQQPEFNFGQSWPSLVYLPLFAFLDSTQRYMMLGANTFRFSEFIDEVTPHEIAHQWWGHLVGWNSYHDQWLSEGFADFSAGLFLEATNKSREQYLKYWERGRKAILEKTSFGYAPNDAGPIWMGIRLDTFKTPRAYNEVVYPKGGFVLHMLRYLMQDSKTGDADFIAMMHDFTAKFAGKNASSGDFQSVVEQHMKPAMDLEGNHSMRWFFAQWVYGIQAPSYHLDYRLSTEPDGKVLFTAKVTQSGVQGNFLARVPIYLDFGLPSGPVRLVNVGVGGNNTSAEIKTRLPQKPKKVLLDYNFDVLARDVSVSEY